jgi:hypothetical protein
MHQLVTRASIALIAISGMLVLGTTSAFASGSAPAPSCDSYSSRVFCEATAGTAPYTWTETIRQDGTSYTSSFPADDINGGCDRGQSFFFSYSYVSGGVTYYSATAGVACDTYPPE